MTPPTEEALRAAATAAFVNAQDLCDEAKLLVERKRYPRATALALIGIEEFAKSVIWVVAALQPAERHLLPARLDGHELKHYTCQLADAAVSENEEGWAAIGYPETPVGWLADLFSALCGWGLTSLLDQKGANRYYRERRDHHARENKKLADLRGDPERDIFLETREPDLKNASLYVDLSPTGAVQSPEGRVGSRAADISIRGLDYFLKQYRPIPEVVSDDALWAALVADVRHRVR